jgi:hypothetical protein
VWHCCQGSGRVGSVQDWHRAADVGSAARTGRAEGNAGSQGTTDTMNTMSSGGGCLLLYAAVAFPYDC